MEMTPERWRYTSNYLREVFGESDDHLQHLTEHAAKAGLPDHAVSPDVGRLLTLLVSMTEGKLALEVGTLGGYSGIWLARGLSSSGRLITIEHNDLHADFAEQQFQRAGLSAQVEVRRGEALEELPKLAQSLGPESVDAIFLDALKTEYPDYWRICRPMLKKGGLLLADNVLGSIKWWIDSEENPHRAGADALNRAVAQDSDFEAVAVPIREGILIARRVGTPK